MFGGGNQGPFNDGIMAFAGWIVAGVLAFFVLAMTLDFIQTRVDPGSKEQSAGAENYFAKVDKRKLVKSVVSGQDRRQEEY